jgi:hypothetical protein
MWEGYSFVNRTGRVWKLSPSGIGGVGKEEAFYIHSEQ